MHSHPSRRAQARLPALRLAMLLLLALSVLLPACGSTEPPYNGIIRVDNRTDTTTPEILYTFFVSPFGQAWTGDLLGGDLPPGATRSLGVFGEDYYDAEGDLELGDVVQWFDIFIGEGATTVFEVF